MSSRGRNRGRNRLCAARSFVVEPKSVLVVFNAKLMGALPLGDIRDRAHLGHEDIIGLNFIRSDAPFVFRRHFRSGMRSQIMEVLPPAEVRHETEGMLRDGVRWYPRAEPRFMLRLFRRRFVSLNQALEEIRRLRVVEAYLDADQMARSSEFIVTYNGRRGADILLCGLQEYAPGHTLDPWQLSPPAGLARRFPPSGRLTPPDFVMRLRANAVRFIDAVRRMAFETRLIPDLAGTRNLVVTDDGNIRLVDINNVSRVHFEAKVSVDDKGYPVCDKSVEALWRMETVLADRSPDSTDPLYGHFLAAERMARVADLDRRFHRRLAPYGPDRPATPKPMQGDPH